MSERSKEMHDALKEARLELDDHKTEEERQEKARAEVYEAAIAKGRRPRTYEKELARRAQINHNRAIKKARKPKRKDA